MVALVERIRMRIEIPFLYQSVGDAGARWHVDVVEYDVPELSRADVEEVSIVRRKPSDDEAVVRRRLVLFGGRLHRSNDEFLRASFRDGVPRGTVSVDDPRAGQKTHAVFAPSHAPTGGSTAIDVRDPGSAGDASRDFHRERALSILSDLVLVEGRIFDGSTDPVSSIPDNCRNDRNGDLVWMDPRFGWRLTDAAENVRSSIAIPPYRVLDGSAMPPWFTFDGPAESFRTRLREEAVNCAHAARCTALRLLGVQGVLPGAGVRDLMPELARAVSRYADHSVQPPSSSATAGILIEIGRRIADPMVQGLGRGYAPAVRTALVAESAVFSDYWRDHGAKLAEGRMEETFETRPEAAFDGFSM